MLLISCCFLCTSVWCIENRGFNPPKKEAEGSAVFPQLMLMPVAARLFPLLLRFDHILLLPGVCCVCVCVLNTVVDYFSLFSFFSSLTPPSSPLLSILTHCLRPAQDARCLHPIYFLLFLSFFMHSFHSLGYLFELTCLTDSSPASLLPSSCCYALLLQNPPFDGGIISSYGCCKCVQFCLPISCSPFRCAGL